MTILPADGAHAPARVLAPAVRAVQEGQLIIYPTDTLYAIGGSAFHAEAARRVRRAKGRDDGKPLPVVAGDVHAVRTLVRSLPLGVERLMDRFWPGPLTLVLPCLPTVPDEVTSGGGSIAVRVPGLFLTRALCLAAGPLVSTSANRAGAPAPLTCADAVSGVGEAAVLAIDAGPGTPLPSTIVEVTTGEPALVREGAIPWAEVSRVWG